MSMKVLALGVQSETTRLENINEISLELIGWQGIH